METEGIVRKNNSVKSSKHNNFVYKFKQKKAILIYLP